MDINTEKREKERQRKRESEKSEMKILFFEKKWEKAHKKFSGTLKLKTE